jgi:hypothetical protein
MAGSSRGARYNPPFPPRPASLSSLQDWGAQASQVVREAKTSMELRIEDGQNPLGGTSALEIESRQRHPNAVSRSS